MTRVQFHKFVAVAGALFIAGCSASATTRPSAPPPVAVEVAPVVFQPLQQWDDFTGRLEAIQSVEVRPRVGGYIDAANLPEGAHVHKGELLFQIDPRPFQAEVDRAAAQLLKAKADAALARADAARASRLIAEQAIAQGEFDRLDAATKAAEADVAAAKAALDNAQLNLSFTHVVSPIDGRVSKALITRGNLVTTASLLTTVVSDGPIYATFNADEQTFLKYAAAQRGQGGPVLMGLMTEDGFPRQGRLQFLDNTVDPRSGTIDARAIFDNADGKLTPGLFARVRLMSSDAHPAALVPEQALAADLGNHYVLVLDGRNHAQYRRVTLGPVLGQLRVIRSGLNPGEQVVTAGLTKIKPGDVVQPTRVAPPALVMNAVPAAPAA
jgi:membrane fusion protein, multidrug efflux system